MKQSSILQQEQNYNIPTTSSLTTAPTQPAILPGVPINPRTQLNASRPPRRSRTLDRGKHFPTSPQVRLQVNANQPAANAPDADTGLLRGKWSKPGIPHKGWTCLEVRDLGQLTTTCEMCESQRVRYVHRMKHPDYKGVLQVGCDCASWMEDDYTAAPRRERQLKTRPARIRKWITDGWRTSQLGNDYRNAYGFNIVVFQRLDGWSYRITNRDTEEQWTAPQSYDSDVEAKLAALGRLEELRATQKSDDTQS